ncbi:MAG: general secretion pathway protein J, partial [Gammaproteobacteria bacterium]|nr:general secretion pathway protein J [Gammaproteobacteria bacterium]
LLALMSWRGLEAMALGQSINRERGDAVLTLQTSLAQWGADLDATVVLAQTRSLDWNGQVLRLTRRSTDSDLPVIYVVAWTLRPDPEVGARWRRWQSPGVTTHADWQEAWDRAAAWGQDGSNDLRTQDVGLMPLEAWQLLYFRNNTWGPAVSAESLGTTTPLPDGVRLILSLPPGRALAGLVTRDWVRPTVATPKS